MHGTQSLLNINIFIQYFHSHNTVQKLYKLNYKPLQLLHELIFKFHNSIIIFFGLQMNIIHRMC